MIENEEENNVTKKIERMSFLTTDAVAASAPTFVHPHQPDQQHRLPRQRHSFLAPLIFAKDIFGEVALQQQPKQHRAVLQKGAPFLPLQKQTTNKQTN